MTECGCFSYLSFRLSNVHVDQLRALHTQEVDAALCGNCFGHQRFASTCTQQSERRQFLSLQQQVCHNDIKRLQQNDAAASVQQEMMHMTCHNMQQKSQASFMGSCHLVCHLLYHSCATVCFTLCACTCIMQQQLCSTCSQVLLPAISSKLTRRAI